MRVRTDKILFNDTRRLIYNIDTHVQLTLRIRHHRTQPSDILLLLARNNSDYDWPGDNNE